MKPCKSCGAAVSNRTMIEGKEHNTSSRRYCLICVPFGSRKKDKDISEKECPCCRHILPKASFYTRENGGLSSWCRTCANEEALERQRKFKRNCVFYKGGSCQSCGYNKCIGALEFHHRDPSKKDFGFGKRRSYTWSKAVEAELDKCDILCANCHREVHERLD